MSMTIGILRMSFIEMIKNLLIRKQKKKEKE